ncbi:hypothetical protein D9619_004104 [Psilocybe cf. subviscida]|uniref:NACHT domain-containing protein n=1 Tax=Psilocybe cf. subviscida TaxID=2480587 RepID=A0A8H5BPT3_9AGAR|nr:hypothetical protein D9619_004104 [Psilocybe cf. subviscida]
MVLHSHVRSFWFASALGPGPSNRFEALTMIHQETPPLLSGSILQSASHVVINGGSFVGSQNSVTTTVNEPTKWLECLYRKVAHNAILNAGGRADEVRCFPGTREEVLAKIEGWIDTKEYNHERRIFWLSGPAGAGKSAIVQTVAEQCIARHLPIINFFFFRGDHTRNHARHVVATLLCQLINLYPKLKPLIRDLVRANPMIFKQSTRDQFEQLINNPVRSIIDLSIDKWPVVILVDGLDECDSAGKHDQELLLRALYGLVSCENSPFIVLVASRPEPHLTMTFNDIGSCAESVFLDEHYRPSDDIRLFVVADLARIKSTHHLGHTLDEHWPSNTNIDAIVDKSSGQFIYAATDLRFIAASSASPAHSLRKLLGLRPVKKSSPFAQLDAIYTHILSQAEDWEAARDVLAAQIFIFLSRPSGSPRAQHIRITIHTMLRPLGYDVDDFASHTSDLMGIVRFNHELEQLQFYHASLSDFLRDSTRSGEYYIDISAFIVKLAPAHIRRIWDFDSLLTSFFIIAYVDQPTPFIDESLTVYPPHFEWPNTEMDVIPFIMRFLRKLQKLYFHGNNQFYKLTLRNWLFWFRDMKLVLQDGDLESIELANAIWNEITTSKVDSSARLQKKKAPLWKRLLRAS